MIRTTMMATKGERTRDHILDEASRLIQRKGIGATSIGEILAAAGVHKGSLYFHFQDKEEVGREVIRRAANRFLGFVNSSLAGATPQKALENFFVAALAYHRRTGFVVVGLFGNTALETSDADPGLAALVEEVFVAWIDRIAWVIAAGQRAGEFRDEITAFDLAQQVVATLEGGIMLSRLHKKAGPLESCIENFECSLPYYEGWVSASVVDSLWHPVAEDFVTDEKRLFGFALGLTPPWFIDRVAFDPEQERMCNKP